jgi:hypothetical protein
MSRRRPFRSDPIRLHRRFRDVNTQLAQLAYDAWRAPDRISLPHRADKIANLFGNRRTAGRATLAQSPPVLPEPSLLPSHDGAGLDKGEHGLPS